MKLTLFESLTQLDGPLQKPRTLPCITHEHAGFEFSGLLRSAPTKHAHRNIHHKDQRKHAQKRSAREQRRAPEKTRQKTHHADHHIHESICRRLFDAYDHFPHFIRDERDECECDRGKCAETQKIKSKADRNAREQMHDAPEIEPLPFAPDIGAFKYVTVRRVHATHDITTSCGRGLLFGQMFSNWERTVARSQALRFPVRSLSR